jgi:hypothetical protein
VVVVADRDTPTGHDQVAEGCVAQCVPQIVRAVACDAKLEGGATRRTNSRGEGVAVRVADLPWTWLLVDVDELVTGGQHRDVRPADDVDL